MGGTPTTTSCVGNVADPRGRNLPLDHGTRTFRVERLPPEPQHPSGTTKCRLSSIDTRTAHCSSGPSSTPTSTPHPTRSGGHSWPWHPSRPASASAGTSPPTGVHPYDEVEWERRDARITNCRDGSVAFEQLDVEFPVAWSLNATNIVAQKYFRGTLGTPERESSLRQVIDRVADTITAWGVEGGYFVDDDEAETFSAELKYLLVTQKAAFNSPGVVQHRREGRAPAGVSACFILSVDDKMDSILNWYVEEGMIFKGGSGAGINLSRIRSSHELLKGGGTASGPVSFMRGADASAGTIKCGRQDPPRRQDGHPRRRPPRRRGVHLVQGP